MVGSRQKGQPDREIYNLFAALNQEQQREKHDIHGIYEGRLRSHAQNFEVSGKGAAWVLAAVDLFRVIECEIF